MKLALGSVQFGLDYGAFNPAGQASRAEVAGILDVAHASGMDLIDTAQAYGESERVLGELDAARRFRLVTKLPGLDDGADVEARVAALVRGSLARLGARSLAGLMLHRGEDLLGPHGSRLWRALEALRAQGLVDLIGVSAHDPVVARQVLDRFPIGLVQVPVNVFDGRYAGSGFLDDCQRRGVEVHARSVFLQGFVLADARSLPPHHRPFAGLLEDFRRRCQAHGLTPLQAALGHVLNMPQVARIVVGVCGAGQLRDIVAASACTSGAWPPGLFGGLADRAPVDLVDPSRWVMAGRQERSRETHDGHSRPGG